MRGEVRVEGWKCGVEECGVEECGGVWRSVESGANRAGKAGEGACDYYRQRNSNMAAGY